MDQIMTVREAQADAGSDDSLLYPTPTGERDTIHLEARDGAAATRISAKSLTLRDAASGDKVARLEDITLQVLVTDARVAIVCSKFDKGGGGVPVGFGVKLDFLFVGAAIGKVAAMVRRRGKAFVGQVRYPWLRTVQGSTRHGMLGREEIRLVFELEGGARQALELELPKNLDAMAVAAEIARRAARYRLLAEPTLSDEARTRLTKLSDATPGISEKGKWIGHGFPDPHVAGPDSARLTPVEAVPR